MSYEDYRNSQRLAGEETFEAIIMAYMRIASGDTLISLQVWYPQIWKELCTRYNAPGGKLEGEE